MACQFPRYPRLNTGGSFYRSWILGLLYFTSIEFTPIIYQYHFGLWFPYYKIVYVYSQLIFHNSAKSTLRQKSAYSPKSVIFVQGVKGEME